MKRNSKHIELEQFCMFLRRAGLTASAGLSCLNERTAEGTVTAVLSQWIGVLCL